MLAAVLLPLLLCAAPPAPSPAPALPAAAPAAGCSLDEILAALAEVETGGHPEGGRHARGDGGSALGPYQIHRAYWLDARLPGAWEDCAGEAYSRRVVLAYWRRWCPRALQELDAETLARVHNGGPRGAGKASTLAYWRRVEAALLRRRAADADADATARAAGLARVTLA